MVRRNIILLIILLIGIGVSACSKVDTFIFNYNHNYEIAFTPRFTYAHIFNTSPTSTPDYKEFFGIMRLQFGRKVFRNNYLHIFCDLVFRKTTNQTYHSNYQGYVYGLQYERKMYTELFVFNKFKIYSKQFNLKFYPNLLVTTGITKLNSSAFSNDTNFKGNFHLYQAYGTGFSFLINKYFNLQLIYQLEYQKSLKSLPFKFQQFQTKLILML